MEKQELNEEFKKMQRLAGIITENATPNITPLTDDEFDELVEFGEWEYEFSKEKGQRGDYNTENIPDSYNIDKVMVDGEDITDRLTSEQWDKVYAAAEKMFDDEEEWDDEAMYDDDGDF